MSEHRLLAQTAEEYFSEFGVSATLLDWMSISPAHGKAYLDGELEESSDAMSLGTLCHTALFQPDLLTEEAFHFQPEWVWVEKERVAKLSSAIPVLDKDGHAIVDGENIQVRWNGQLVECKNWTKTHGDKEIIGTKQWQIAVKVRDNAHRTGVVRALLSGGYAEQSLFVEDNHGTMRKCRFDYFSTSGNVIPDLKTCRSAQPDDFEKTILNNRLFQRAAFYIDNANLAGLSKDAFVFICVETAPPYLVACYQLEDMILEAGRALYKRDLQLYRNCVESGKWPGYHEGIRQIGVPPFAQRQLEEVL